MATSAASRQPWSHAPTPNEQHKSRLSMPISHHQAATYQPRDVTTTLYYHGQTPNDDQDSSIQRPTEPHECVVHDIRGHEHQYILDSNGFQLVSHTTTCKEFVDEGKFLKTYYNELEEMLLEITGAARVHCFSYTVRGPGARKPVTKIHVDQSPADAILHPAIYLPNEGPQLLQQHRRYRMINIWRPLRPVLKDPLGVVEATSVLDSDLVASPFFSAKKVNQETLKYPASHPMNRNGETLTLKYNEGQRWCYFNDMTPDECLLIKCFDSEGVARRTPHTSFTDPERDLEEDRMSIEVRAMVFGG